MYTCAAEARVVDTAYFVHRLHFGFLITFHYLFPQLTMGLAPLIVILKTIALRTESPAYDNAARFCMRIFGINFVLGVVTGIPMEFQFGTNWARFSHMTGGVIGQALLSGISISRAFPVRRKAAQSGCALVDWVHGFRRLVVIWFLHHCYRRLDATSCRLHTFGRRLVPGE